MRSRCSGRADAMPRAPLLVQAARREPVERTPVWFMRQAGRILPEYRAIRERLTLIEISQRPDVAAEVTATTRSGRRRASRFIGYFTWL